MRWDTTQSSGMRDRSRYVAELHAAMTNGSSGSAGNGQAIGLSVS